MPHTDTYEAVIGLEVHVQLNTNSKLFCGDDASFLSSPNKHIGEWSLALPGVMPALNEHALLLAIRLGAAMNSQIAGKVIFERKHYWHPDMPAGYQLTQHSLPLCTGGRLAVNVNGKQKNFRIKRMHLEEDAARSITSDEQSELLLDFNRAGVALLEIVTEPCFQSPEEVASFLEELRRVVRHLEVSKGNMEEGNLRCDVNISIRKKDAPIGQVQTEIKNLNSIRHCKQAISLEVNRLVQAAQDGSILTSETRAFDAKEGVTRFIRIKTSGEYRYLQEPDLPVFSIPESWIENARKTLPALPAQIETQLREEYGLEKESIHLICSSKDAVGFFEKAVQQEGNPVEVAKWMKGPISKFIEEKSITWKEFPVAPERLTKLMELVENGSISYGVAVEKVFSELLENPLAEPLQLVQEQNLFQESNPEILKKWIDNTLVELPEEVALYRSGKKNVVNVILAAIRHKSNQRANLTETHKLLIQKLN